MGSRCLSHVLLFSISLTWLPAGSFMKPAAFAAKHKQFLQGHMRADTRSEIVPAT